MLRVPQRDVMQLRCVQGSESRVDNLTRSWANTGQIQTNAAKAQKTEPGPLPMGAKQDFRSESHQVVWVLKEKPQCSPRTITIQNLHGIPLRCPGAIQNYQRTKSHENMKTLNLTKASIEKSRANSLLNDERLNAVSCELYLAPYKNEIKMDHIPKYNT